MVFRIEWGEEESRNKGARDEADSWKKEELKTCQQSGVKIIAR